MDLQDVHLFQEPEVESSFMHSPNNPKEDAIQMGMVFEDGILPISFLLNGYWGI